MTIPNKYPLHSLSKAQAEKFFFDSSTLELLVKRGATSTGVVSRDDETVVIHRTSRNVGFGFDVVGPNSEQSFAMRAMRAVVDGC